MERKIQSGTALIMYKTYARVAALLLHYLVQVSDIRRKPVVTCTFVYGYKSMGSTVALQKAAHGQCTLKQGWADIQGSN